MRRALRSKKRRLGNSVWDKFTREYGGFSGWVWLAIAGALVVRLLINKTNSGWVAIKETMVGLFCAFVFTKPTLDITGMPRTQDMLIFTAVLWAILGGKVLLMILQSESLAELIRAWRGK